MDHQETDQKSKSQLKREMSALQALGEQLVALSPSKLAALALPEALREAVVLARNIHAHGGRRRQLQYIGRLMRDIDAEPIRVALDADGRQSQQEAAHFQRLERWRDRLLAEGDAAVEDFLAEHPHTDRQHLRQLLRTAHKEAQAQKAPRAARALFKYLRELAAAAD